MATHKTRILLLVKISSGGCSLQSNIEGKFLKKLVLHRWGVLQTNLVLSTGLIMQIGHQRKAIRKLTFRALDLRWSEGLTLEKSVFESLYADQFALSTQLIKLIFLEIGTKNRIHVVGKILG